jgi:hypothetical protein
MIDLIENIKPVAGRDNRRAIPLWPFSVIRTVEDT